MVMNTLIPVLLWAAIIQPIKGTPSRVHRNAHPITLNYGDQGHPYEAYSSASRSSTEMVEDNRRTQDSSLLQRYPVKKPSVFPTISPSQKPSTSAPTLIAYDPSLYEPLRIHIDTRRLEYINQNEPSKSAFLTHLQLAATKAASFWSRHLSTIPTSTSIAITPRECPLAFDEDINTNLHTFDETDLIVYLFVDEGPCIGEERPPIAFSDECAMDQFDRPVAGWLLICSENFQSISSNDNEGASQRQKLDEVLQHEIAHILGMSGSTMAYWRDPLKGGAPRTSRPLTISEITCVNGTTINTTIPSQSTVRDGVTNSGVRFFEVVTPTVRNVVANQFDCEDATGARLDNFEHFDCIGSHWSSRYFGVETMVSRNMPWEQSITALTLALFEDTGWYKANFTASLGSLSPPSFGYGAGCDFLMNDCIMDDNVPESAEGTFCKILTTESPIRCDVSHRRFAKCDLVDYSHESIYPYLNTPPAPGSEYNYFTNTNLGSSVRYDADYCPTYAAPPYSTYDNHGIANGSLYAECSLGRDMIADVYDFESFGSDTSRCVNTLGAIERPLCLNIECVLSGDLSLVVTVTDGEKVICESDGQIINLEGLNVQIECPRREVICPEYFCPANCSGRGLCHHQKVNGCQCYDFTDDSSSCENSPTQHPEEMPVLSPTQMPTISVTTSFPTVTPSKSPAHIDETNFPSVIAAIVSPTLSSSIHVEVAPEEDFSDVNSSLNIFRSHLQLILLFAHVAAFVFYL